MYTAPINRLTGNFMSLTSETPAVLCRLMAVFAVLFAGVGAAQAQTTDVEPHHVIVTTETASLRCGGGEIWYPVGEVKRGDILLADGESFGWLRVKYPEGAMALVSVDDAEFVAGRGVVRLTRPSRLSAYNPNADVRDSWRRLLPNPVPAATEFEHHETLNDSRGEIAGFLVTAPAESRGYINEQFVRRATDDEVRAFRNAGRAEAERESRPQEQIATAPETRPRAPETTVEPTRTQSQTPTPEPRATEPAPFEVPTPRPLEREPVVLDMEPVDRTERQRADARDQAEDMATIERGVGNFEQLDRAFKAVVREPIRDAELEPLLAEHRRLLDSLGDSDEELVIAAAVGARVELLQIRVELQKDLHRLAALEERATRGITEIREAVTLLEARRQYAAVGRLSTSSIYNGERLPLMYRLQSADTSTPRTIAYIAPSEGVDLRGMLGTIVGVEGDAQMDPALRLNIIRPKHVDALRVETATATAPVPDENE